MPELELATGTIDDDRKHATSARPRQMLEVCGRLRFVDRPASVVWTPRESVRAAPAVPR